MDSTEDVVSITIITSAIIHLSPSLMCYILKKDKGPYLLHGLKDTIRTQLQLRFNSFVPQIALHVIMVGVLIP